MMTKFRSLTVGLALFGLASAASAVPVTYNFYTGTQSLAYGTGVGLLPAGVTVSGSFTYDADAPFLTSGFNGAGSIYQSITNFSMSVGGYSAFDAVGYNVAANDLYYTTLSTGTVVPRYDDLIELYAGPTGGSWSSFSVGGHELARVRLFWLENLLGATDFLSSEGLPAVLPSFQGRLALDFGPIVPGGFPPGIVWFDGLYAAPVTVPEPGTLALAVFGLAMLGVASRKRRLAMRPCR